MDLRNALGEDRWVILQRSSIKDEIRNVNIDDVTFSEMVLIAEALRHSIQSVLSVLIHAKYTDSHKVYLFK